MAGAALAFVAWRGVRASVDAPTVASASVLGGQVPARPSGSAHAPNAGADAGAGAKSPALPVDTGAHAQP
jgi:hypothetical protein